MKLGGEVKNGEQSLNLELEVVGVVYQPPNHLGQIHPKFYANSANIGPILIKFGMAFKNGE